MKKIKLLATGGTIASQAGESGLEPKIGSSGMLECLNGYSPDITFDCEDIFNMDSSNIQPEEWQIIARKVYASLAAYDGVIITHGTDTMAYTAAALSFMLQNLNKSVVLTGSQIPIGFPLTDAKTNLYTAISAIESGIKGVLVAFDRKIINGTRAVKTSTMDFDAFQSVNAGYMGQIFADGIRVFSGATAPPSDNPLIRENLCADVFLLKLIPGTKPEIFEALAGLKYKAIVIEAFGAGGMHYLHRNLLDKLRVLSSTGITVAVCSQCLYERSDLSLYEVGQRILKAGAISALDMTTEAAVTKLMWIFGQTSDKHEAEKLFYRNIAGEISAPAQK